MYVRTYINHRYLFSIIHLNSLFLVVVPNLFCRKPPLTAHRPGQTARQLHQGPKAREHSDKFVYDFNTTGLWFMVQI